MGISIWQLLIILLITVVLFGTKKLKNVGSDLGEAIRSFRQSMRDGETLPEQAEKGSGKSDETQQVTHLEKKTVIEGQVTNERTKQG